MIQFVIYNSSISFLLHFGCTRPPPSLFYLSSSCKRYVNVNERVKPISHTTFFLFLFSPLRGSQYHFKKLWRSLFFFFCLKCYFHQIRKRNNGINQILACVVHEILMQTAPHTISPINVNPHQREFIQL